MTDVAYGMNGGEEKLFWRRNLEQIYHIEDLGVDGEIILKWIAMKWYVITWIRIIWLRMVDKKNCFGEEIWSKYTTLKT